MYYAAGLAQCKEYTIVAGAWILYKAAPTTGSLVWFS